MSCNRCFKEKDPRCKKAKYLSNFHIVRSNKVILLGHGNINANVMIIGHSPSLHPEGNRVIFGHRSYKIFSEMLKIWGFKFEEIFISNVVFCYIPTYKTGDFGCPYIEKLVEIINPRICILFGREVVERILGKSYPLVARKVIKDGRVYVTCYHPMYAVRSPDNAERVLETARKVKKCFNGTTLDYFLYNQSNSEVKVYGRKFLQNYVD